MSWDRKKLGKGARYYYRSIRVPELPHPVKIYCGRGEGAQKAAALVEKAKKDRQSEREALRAEMNSLAGPDQLAAELSAWTAGLTAVTLFLTGHRYHNGEWRPRHG